MVPAIEAEEVVEEPEQVPEPPEACLLRDADLLEAWSRGETLIIDDEFQIEQGNGHIEGDLSLGTKARRLRRRVKRRVRRIQEDLLASEIDADIDAESFMEEAIAQGQSWWSEGMEVGDADFEGLEDLDLEETQEIEDSDELEELEEFGNEEVEPVELLEEGEEELECEADPLHLLDPLDQLDQSTDQEAEELEEGVEERPASTASLVPAARISKEEPRKRARLVPEKSQTLAVARLRSRPQLKPAVGADSKAGEKRKTLPGSTDLTDPMQARYMPPHEKRRRIELAKWKEIKAAWHRKLLEEEAQGPRKQKQKAEPNMRALADRKSVV